MPSPAAKSKLPVEAHQPPERDGGEAAAADRPKREADDDGDEPHSGVEADQKAVI